MRRYFGIGLVFIAVVLLVLGGSASGVKSQEITITVNYVPEFDINKVVGNTALYEVFQAEVFQTPGIFQLNRQPKGEYAILLNGYSQEGIVTFLYDEEGQIAEIKRLGITSVTQVSNNELVYGWRDFVCFVQFDTSGEKCFKIYLSDVHASEPWINQGSLALNGKVIAFIDYWSNVWMLDTQTAEYKMLWDKEDPVNQVALSSDAATLMVYTGGSLFRHNLHTGEIAEVDNDTYGYIAFRESGLYGISTDNPAVFDEFSSLVGASMLPYPIGNAHKTKFMNFSTSEQMFSSIGTPFVFNQIGDQVLIIGFEAITADLPEESIPPIKMWDCNFSTQVCELIFAKNFPFSGLIVLPLDISNFEGKVNINPFNLQGGDANYVN